MSNTVRLCTECCHALCVDCVNERMEQLAYSVTQHPIIPRHIPCRAAAGPTTPQRHHIIPHHSRPVTPASEVSGTVPFEEPPSEEADAFPFEEPPSEEADAFPFEKPSSEAADTTPFEADTDSPSCPETTGVPSVRGSPGTVALRRRRRLGRSAGTLSTDPAVFVAPTTGAFLPPLVFLLAFLFSRALSAAGEVSATE